MKPNIFNYATSELSQDAVLCWMLDWANFDNKIMSDFAKDFIRLILELHPYEDQDLDNLEKVEIKRQYKNIDILVLLHFSNTIVPIIIEDKTYTKTHSNQLQRYYEIILKDQEGKSAIETPLGIYYKTGFIYDNEMKEVKERGYKVIGKVEMLDLMKQYIGQADSDILKDYYQHISRLADWESQLSEIIRENKTEKTAELLRTPEGQWMLMREIFQNYEEGILYNGTNPNGSPWTQYRIIPYNSYKELPDAIFYRVDKRKEGYYIAIRQYLKIDKKSLEYNSLLEAKKERLERLKGCFDRTLKILGANTIEVLKSGEISNSGNFESEIGVFFINENNTLSKVIEIIPKFNEAFKQEVEKTFNHK